MDEIEVRLKECADACIKSYEAWCKEKKDSSSREALLESVHELRKVASRLEIEIAISERENMADKPLPIPPHRASRAGRGDNGAGDNILDAQDNDQGANGNGGPSGGRRSRGRRSSQRSSGN